MQQNGEGTQGEILHCQTLRRHARLLAQARRRALDSSAGRPVG
ncbi:hypothetical protein LINGRAPRIM_LOCUS1538 [Linum grandiflorum]